MGSRPLSPHIVHMDRYSRPRDDGSPYDINSPTDSVIGRDFQELSAEEQERQREEWKAELKKTEEEILTLKQVLTAKERHAAGLKRRLGITQWREFSEDMTQGLKNLQESATYKRTAENLQFAKDIAREKSAGLIAGISASSTFQNLSGSCPLPSELPRTGCPAPLVNRR